MRSLVLPLALLLLACDKPRDASPADPKAANATAADAKAPDAQQDESAQDPAPSAQPPIAADAKAEVGAPAPDFTLEDLEGKAHALTEYRGKTVVLEWFNPGCPFVKYAHTEGPLVSMAKDEVAKDVVWLAINSGAPGKQGHGADASGEGKATFGMEHPILLDDSGAVGHAYGAEKTPHVYLIDAQGTLVYRGAIDNAPFGEVDGGGETRNHLAAALEELRAGKAISTAQTPPYGCTVKY